MFQTKIDELFNAMPNVDCIVNDTLIAGFGELVIGHTETLNKVLQVSRQACLRLNKDKYLFRCTSIPFFGKVISQQSISLDPR